MFLISQTSYRTYKIILSYELARPVMGTIFLVLIVLYYNYSVEILRNLHVNVLFGRELLASIYSNGLSFVNEVMEGCILTSGMV